jgi:hypothetical protein
MRNIFGWSYPPGCSGTPWDDPDPPCEVCGEDPYYCICPECPVCNDVGNRLCYINHGLHRSELQKFYLECNKRDWKADSDAMNYADDWNYADF